MPSSVHPLGERSKGNRYGVTATAPIVEAALGGAILGVVAGLIALGLGHALGPRPREAVLLAVAVAAAALELAGAEQMTTMDVLICLLEFDPASTGTHLFARRGIPRFRGRDFAPDTMQRTTAGMCGAQSFSSESGRAFNAYMVLGSYQPRDTLAPAVNVLLRSVRIDPL
jgi:hypothetical protein